MQTTTPGAASRRASTSVVVADADEDVRNLAQLTFASESWSVRETVDAAATVRTIAAAVPEVLVVGADLPGAGGRATVRALRGQSRTAGIGVVLLAEADAALDEELADAVLPRPFDPLSLFVAVEQVLGRVGRA